MLEEKTTDQNEVVQVIEFDDASLKDLEKNVSDLVEIIKDEQLADKEADMQLVDLVEILKENQEIEAEEKELAIQQQEEKEALMLIENEVDPDAVDLSDIYDLLKTKIEQDTDFYNSLEYLTCPEILEETEEETTEYYLCHQLDDLKKGQDQMIIGTDIVVTYGILYLPLVAVVMALWFFFSPFLKTFR